MILFAPSCIKSVDDICHHIDTPNIKNGKTANGTQRYKCKNCGRSFMHSYRNNAFYPAVNRSIIGLLREGCGIRGIARLLSISATTVLRRMLSIAAAIPRPAVAPGRAYEVDELCTSVKTKNDRVWIVYALCRDTKAVVDFNVGPRSCKTLAGVIDTLLYSSCSTIYTDRLPLYRCLIPPALHKALPYATNHIERMNLTLRTKLKRLHRRSICFSKSLLLLVACLRICFWA